MRAGLPLLSAVAVSLAFLTGAPAAEAQPAGDAWAIVGGTVLDGSASPLAAGVVVGSGERITCVGAASACPVPTGARVLDATGRWVIPGLIDTHVHLDWRDGVTAARAQLVRFALGITTTREAGTSKNFTANLAHRDVAREPGAPEPRLVVSALVSSEHMAAFEATSLGDLVQRLAAERPDAIKVKLEGPGAARVPGDFDAADWKAVVSTAHTAGLPVWGHTWTEERSGLAEATAAGIDGVAHMFTFAEYARPHDSAPPATLDTDFWVGTKERWHRLNADALARGIRMTLEHTKWFEPLLVTEHNFTLPYPVPGDVEYLSAVPSLRQLMDPLMPGRETSWLAVRERRGRIDAAFHEMCEFVRGYDRAGGVMIAGSDTEPAGFTLSEEVGLLHACGLTPQKALAAATATAAVALRRDDIGVLRAGALGDAVVIDGDPLEDAANLRRVWRVVKGGRVYDPDALLGQIKSDHRAHWWRSWSKRGLALAGVVAMLIAVRFRSRLLGAWRG